MGKYRILDNNLWGLKGIHERKVSFNFSFFHQKKLGLCLFQTEQLMSRLQDCSVLWIISLK